MFDVLAAAAGLAAPLTVADTQRPAMAEPDALDRSAVGGGHRAPA
ncbi:hypothetical protein ACQPYK_20505 [Streptosporangium sp. CA-135522]